MKDQWRSLQEHDELASAPGRAAPEIAAEFADDGIVDEEARRELALSRRGFLKTGVGVGVVGSTVLSGCGGAVNRATPYLSKPDSVVPGVAYHYASTFFDGNDFCSVLVKTREGRPIKIEGNDLCLMSGGGTNARVQASVLSLYDDARLKVPLKAKTETSWETVDAEIVAALNDIAKAGGKIAIVTSTIASPSTESVLQEFVRKYPTTEVIAYDAISASGMLEANKVTFGTEHIPSYLFHRADIVVSFGADFLGTWISPIEFSRQYSSRKQLPQASGQVIRHVQLESTLTLTGSNADLRIPINPSEEGPLLLELYDALAAKAARPTVPARTASPAIVRLADELWTARGRALVVSGANDVPVQIVVNEINGLLESYGATIDNSRPVRLRRGIDSTMDELVARLGKGEFKAAIFYNANPVYDYPASEKLVAGLRGAALTVSLAGTMDETAKVVTYVCPDSHYLESWNDFEPKARYFTLCQPTTNKLFNTRQAPESLLKWAAGALAGAAPHGDGVEEEAAKDGAKTGNDSPYYLHMRSLWQKRMFPLQSQWASFDSFWVDTVQKGVFAAQADAPADAENLRPSGGHVAAAAAEIAARTTEGIELSLYESIALGNGTHANNPWLQELPDPVSKVCWDNYLAVSVDFAGKYGLADGDNVLVNDSFELPVLIQAGQAANTVSIALGYGRASAGKTGDGVGRNAFKLIGLGRNRRYSGTGLRISPTGARTALALTQTHHTMEGRNHVRRATLSEYTKDHTAGTSRGEGRGTAHASLYPRREFKGHHWGLAIDLNRCTGCSTCVIACQAENNVPVVGKDEVHNKRIMHWLRVDRYYASEPENPEVMFQPVMCQHCNNAPCENVCPVEATQNSNEGLNEMAYNRCIGTRYCMNNCPYRVRRFNWFRYGDNPKFDFHMNSSLGRMVLNPEVIVRTRGVVEKCTMCAQRIQERKLQAKLENRELRDGEIKPACAQSCPANAIVFGDLNDPSSAVSAAFADERNYFLLGELNTASVVGYRTKVRNI
jgi:molybdopterin-containing oxidoreductase family iron-sulfur binding subunit